MKKRERASGMCQRENVKRSRKRKGENGRVVLYDSFHLSILIDRVRPRRPGREKGL